VLTNVFFAGDPPAIGSSPFGGTPATIYYLPTASGWTNTFSQKPAVLWNPAMQTGGGEFGVRGNQFGFNLTGTPNIPVVIETATNLASPAWTPLLSTTITNGSIFFGEALQHNEGRYYRIRSP
jgi:hypothetical protein